MTVHQNGQYSMFLMTSGLRSVRDKALTYFEEELEQEGVVFNRLYQDLFDLGHAKVSSVKPRRRR